MPPVPQMCSMQPCRIFSRRRDSATVLVSLAAFGMAEAAVVWEEEAALARRTPCSVLQQVVVDSDLLLAAVDHRDHVRRDRVRRTVHRDLARNHEAGKAADRREAEKMADHREA